MPALFANQIITVEYLAKFIHLKCKISSCFFGIFLTLIFFLILKMVLTVEDGLILLTNTLINFNKKLIYIREASKIILDNFLSQCIFIKILSQNSCYKFPSLWLCIIILSKWELALFYNWLTDFQKGSNILTWVRYSVSIFQTKSNFHR